MKYPQRIQRQTTDDRASQPLHSQAFKTSSFAVQQKSAAVPATKAQLWENYHQAKQLTQLQGANTLAAPAQTPFPSIQAKLTIGQPGDKYEQEADSVADRVMAMSAPAQVQREELPEEEELQMQPLAETISPLVQREELPEAELQMQPEDNVVQREELPEEEELQMKSVDNSIQREELPEEEEELQMKESSTPNSHLPSPISLESQLGNSKGGGSPLSDDVRSFMEPRFGADFSGVRVHTGSDAVQMNQGVNAQAFAHGSDIYFGAGKAPGKDALTAHELTHVVQQSGGAMRSQSTQNKESIQRQVTIDGEVKNRDLHYKEVWEKYKEKKLDQSGDGKIINEIIREDIDHGRKTWDEFVALVATKRIVKEPKKRKHDEKPEGYLPRQNRTVGTKVDFGTDRSFRAERRIRRATIKKGKNLGERNIYVVKKRKPNGDCFKIITVSHPPGQMTETDLTRPIPHLIAKYHPGHSENVTDTIEKSKWDLNRNTKRVSEATTREQCKDCRHKFPSQVDSTQHFFSFLYSAPEDHLEKGPLYDKVIKNKGKVDGFNNDEKKQFHLAENSATQYRQYGENQNPALKKSLKNLSMENSDNEYSSDEESWHVDSFIAELLEIPEDESMTIGKAKVYPIPPEFQVPPDKVPDKKKWVEEQIERLKNPKKIKTKLSEKIGKQEMSDSDNSDIKD
jgi:Domain of unknown function (DUF4157)